MEGNQDDDAAMARRKRELEMQELEVKEKELQVKRLRLEQEEAALLKRSNATSSTGSVELNVGGTFFQTSRETLLQQGSPYFERLLVSQGSDGGSMAVAGAQLDSNNRLFIDRSPKLFESILEYMRTNTLAIPENKVEKKALQQEAEYYQLDGLLERLRLYGQGYDPWYLSAEDRAIQDEAASIRDGFRQGEDGIVKKATELLVNLFDETTQDKNLAIQPNYEQPCSSPEVTILFEKRALASRKKKPHKLPANLKEFQDRFVDFAGPLFKRFPWFEMNQNLIVAGGSVLSALLNNTQRDEDGDIDLFMVAPNAQEARTIYDKIVEHFARPRQNTGIDHNQLLVVRSPFAVTLIVAYPQRNVQIILTHHQCAAEVIFNFDIDCCQVLYDGKNVLATPLGHRALLTGVNIADPERRSANFESRLAKYADRGFRVAVPGLDIGRVNKRYLRNECFSMYGGGLKHVKLEFSEQKGLTKIIVDSEEVVGLSKLLVYAHREEGSGVDRTGEIRLRQMDGKASLPFANRHQHPTVVGNIYLIEAVKGIDMLKRSGMTNWKLPTPPHPPPLTHIQKLIPAGDSGGGGPILVYGKANGGGYYTRPSSVLGHLRKRLDDIVDDPTFTPSHRDSEAEPLCVYDYLENASVRTECPCVEDAAQMYTSYSFPTDDEVCSNQLSRRLRIVSSITKNGDGGGPWVRLDAEGWTDGAYKSS